MAEKKSFKETVKGWWDSLVDAVNTGRQWVYDNLPHWARVIVALLLIVLGLFGWWLPVLGFWMFPLGVILIWDDIKALGRKIRGAFRKHS